MSTQRLSGKSFQVTLGDIYINVESYNLSIDDGRATAKTNGIPNGWLDGEVSASGDIEVDAQNFNLIMQAAKKAGSFKELPPFDIVAYAVAGKTSQKVEAFDCLLKISDLLDISSSGGEKTKHKLPFEVTGTDFVKINGVPYLSENETAGIW